MFSLFGAVILCCMGSSWSALAAPPPRRLDLRPPADTELAASQTSAEDVNNYPAGFSRLRLMRIATHGDTFVQRFGREGLPLARLWENHSALLSLGLSPRGKPGLWLVQKTH
jgi:hypothetical protein